MLFVSPLVQSSELKSPEAKELANELKQTINTTLSKITELERGVGNDNGVSLFLQQDAEAISSLGLVLSNNNKVLLVTPQSQADNLGIESGDQILALRIDNKLKDLSTPLQLTSGQAISVQFMRGEQTKTVSGNIALTEALAWKLQTEIPANQDFDEVEIRDEKVCGRISKFFRPPESRDYYPVGINQINGKTIIRGREIVRLSPGKHVIKLNEYIIPRGLKIRRPIRIKGKLIEIDVEPNKTYHLAAKFDSSKRLKSKDEQYWEPIIWKVSDRSCEL